MDSMDTDLQSLIASYFDCGWEEFENDPKVKDIITEMKGLADIYLKTKSSKNSSMVTTIAMEAELKRLRAELVKRVEKLRKEKDSKQPVKEVAQVETQEEEEVVLEEEVIDNEPVVEMRLPKKKSSSAERLPAIAAGTALIALLLGGLSFFSAKDKMSREDFNDFNRTTRESIMKDVSSSNQTDRTDIEALQGSLQVLRQDLEASKQELAAVRMEMDQRLTAQETHLNAKISSLQESLKKTQKKAPAPAPVKAKAAPLKTAPAKAKTVTKPIRR